MVMTTIKQYAESQNVSYEAVRKQIVRYTEELKEHIVKKDRTQYLDEWAVDFLTERRRENPIILNDQDKTEEIEALRSQVESLKVKLMEAQNELLKEKDRVIGLQDEIREGLESKIKYTALLEDNKAKEEKLKEAQDQITEIRREADDRKREVEELTKERDEAKTEAQSFKKSIFGFYRKG